MSSDRKRARKIKKYNKLTGSNIQAKFRDIKYNNKAIMVK